MDKSQITGSLLEKHFLVDPIAGTVKYRGRTGKWHDGAGYLKTGTQATGGGYRVISVPIAHLKYKKVRAHHLMWAWVYGEWPKRQIDHINRNRDDNRIENLRESTSTQNKFNRGVLRNNKSGFKWCYQEKGTGRWVAQVELPQALRVSNKREWFLQERFDTAEEAYSAACAAAKELHGDFYNPGIE